MTPIEKAFYYLDICGKYYLLSSRSCPADGIELRVIEEFIGDCKKDRLVWKNNKTPGSFLGIMTNIAKYRYDWMVDSRSPRTTVEAAIIVDFINQAGVYFGVDWALHDFDLTDPPREYL